MPFGVTKHAWDKKAMEADELESLLVTVNNINTNSSGTVFIVYMPDEFVGEAAKLFAKRNYTSYDKIFVYKYKQDSRGVNTWIHAVETVYVFFQDSRAHCPHSFPLPDPRRRHNLLFSPPTFQSTTTRGKLSMRRKSRSRPWPIWRTSTASRTDARSFLELGWGVMS